MSESKSFIVKREKCATLLYAVSAHIMFVNGLNANDVKETAKMIAKTCGANSLEINEKTGANKIETYINKPAYKNNPVKLVLYGTLATTEAVEEAIRGNFDNYTYCFLYKQPSTCEKAFRVEQKKIYDENLEKYENEILTVLYGYPIET